MRHTTRIRSFSADYNFTYYIYKVQDQSKFGLGVEYFKEKRLHSIEVDNVSMDGERLVKILLLFADEIVFPEVFEETVLDCISAFDL